MFIKNYIHSVARTVDLNLRDHLYLKMIGDLHPSKGRRQAIQYLNGRFHKGLTESAALYDALCDSDRLPFKFTYLYPSWRSVSFTEQENALVEKVMREGMSKRGALVDYFCGKFQLDLQEAEALYEQLLSVGTRGVVQ